MSIELECKVRVDTHDKIRDRLRAAGASYQGRVREKNRIFDRSDGSLRSAGCGLRVRETIVLDGGNPGHTLTFKGPKLPGEFKQREEIEVVIADADKMAAVLKALNFVERVYFEKVRESWVLGDCHIELDEIAELGLFVEIEGSSDAAIRKTLAAVGLAGSPHVRSSYVAMIAEKQRRP